MPCALPDGLELHFLTSGVRVRPYDVDVNVPSRHFAEASFEVSREAGAVLAEHVDAPEPVHFKVNGEVAYRFFIGEGDITFHFDLHSDEVAELSLRDPLSILDRGTFEKAFNGEYTVEQVFETVLDHRVDPNGVITGLDFAGTDAARRTRDFAQLATEKLEDVPFAGSHLENFDAMVSELVDGFWRDSGELPPNLNFDGGTPLDALNELVSDLELQMWVERDGTLVVGVDLAAGRVLRVSANDNNGVLQRYNVTRRSDAIRGVLLQGPYTGPVAPVGERLAADSGAGLHLAAEVTSDDFPGDTIVDGAGPARSLQGLANQATRRLIKEYMKQTQGSLVLNGLASDDKKTIARLRPGDHIIVDGNVEEHCADDMVVGHFVVTRVHHRANTRQGWRVLAELVDVPDSKLDVKTWVYDPRTDKNYESIEAYQKQFDP